MWTKCGSDSDPRTNLGLSLNQIQISIKLVLKLEDHIGCHLFLGSHQIPSQVNCDHLFTARPPAACQFVNICAQFHHCSSGQQQLANLRNSLMAILHRRMTESFLEEGKQWFCTDLLTVVYICFDSSSDEWWFPPSHHHVCIMLSSGWAQGGRRPSRLLHLIWYTSSAASITISLLGYCNVFFNIRYSSWNLCWYFCYWLAFPTDTWYSAQYHHHRYYCLGFFVILGLWTLLNPTQPSCLHFFPRFWLWHQEEEDTEPSLVCLFDQILGCWSHFLITLRGGDGCYQSNPPITLATMCWLGSSQREAHLSIYYQGLPLYDSLIIAHDPTCVTENHKHMLPPFPLILYLIVSRTPRHQWHTPAYYYYNDHQTFLSSCDIT